MPHLNRIIVAFSLALLTVMLLAYFLYTGKQKIGALEEEVLYYKALYEQQWQELNEFYFLLRSPELLSEYDQLIQESDMLVRKQIAQAIWAEFEGVYATTHEGFELRKRLFGLAEAQDIAKRAALYQDFQDYFQLETGGGIAGAPQAFLSESNIKLFSMLVALLGAVGSGLMSLYTLFTGSTKRRIDEQMLELDLELKKIELAKAQLSLAESAERKS